MASHNLHRTAVVAIIGIVVTFVSVMGQSDLTNCAGGCPSPKVGRNADYVIIKNTNKVDNSSKCFPINTTLLYVCKPQDTYQYGPILTQKELSIKCTGSEWLNGLYVTPTTPNCVRREKHCLSPPIPNRPNIVVQIHGQNIGTHDENTTSLYYSKDTIATYKCKNSEPNAMNDQQVLKCISLKKYFLVHWNYSWEPIKPFSKELDCGSSKVPTESPREMPVVDEPYGGTTKNPLIEETHDFGSETQTNDSARSLPVNFPRDLLIGICSFLGLIMIAVLFGILYKNKTRLGKRYNDTANHARQSPFTSMPEGENKSKGKFADGEENLAMYANIIPIKVNQETIYAEVETGKIGKSRPTNIKLTIDDDQLHTTYAEIRHSVIPEDQRR